MSLDVVICTYNRADDLDDCLTCLAAQSRGEGWQVRVIDNNCTDHTAEVVARHAGSGRLPALSRVVENRQGLTPARQRGLAESSAEWVAFVDDDCMLAPDWVAEVLAFAAKHPAAGAFGGRVVPDWGRPPPRYLARHAWLFAAQDHGAEPCRVDSLVGAGLVVRRAALVATGWLDQPWLADRTGPGYTSGGDVEISMRLTAAGRELWFVPDLVCRHRVAPARQSLRQMMRLARGLGAGAELVSLVGTADPARWPDLAGAIVQADRRTHLASLPWVAAGRYDWRDWLIRWAFLGAQRDQQRQLAGDPEAMARLGGRLHRERNAASRPPTASRAK